MINIALPQLMITIFESAIFTKHILQKKISHFLFMINYEKFLCRFYFHMTITLHFWIFARGVDILEINERTTSRKLVRELSNFFGNNYFVLQSLYISITSHFSINIFAQNDFVKSRN